MAIDNPAEVIKFATSNAHGFPSQEFIGGYEYVAEYSSYTLYVRHRVTGTTFLEIVTKEQIAGSYNSLHFIYTRFCNLVNDAKKWHKQWKKAQTHDQYFSLGFCVTQEMLDKDAVPYWVSYMSDMANHYVGQYRRQLSFYDIGDGHLIPTGYDPEEI